MSDHLPDAMQAVRDGDVDALGALVAAAPELLAECDDTGDTLLGLACRAATGDIAIPPVPGTAEQHACVDLLIAAGADVDAANGEGWTPLHTAAMSGHQDLARRLLAAGASRDGRLYGCDGGSPLSLALFYAKTAMAELLANPPIPDNLRSAAGLGRDLERFFDGDELAPDALQGLDFYRPILAFPAWQRSKDRQEVLDEALTWAARNGQVDAMAPLVDKGANVNANPFRGTALLWAAYANQAEATRWLLEHGADPNLRHDFGGEGHGVNATALHLAAQIDSVDALRELLAHGGDASIVDGAHGGDALGWARFGEARACIELLERQSN